jgi:hypothetical protein
MEAEQPSELVVLSLFPVEAEQSSELAAVRVVLRASSKPRSGPFEALPVQPPVRARPRSENGTQTPPAGTAPEVGGAMSRLEAAAA